MDPVLQWFQPLPSPSGLCVKLLPPEGGEAGHGLRRAVLGCWDVSLPPRLGPASQGLGAVQERPPRSAVGRPQPPARCLQSAVHGCARWGRAGVRLGVLNGFLTVAISARDSSCPRIVSAGVGLRGLSGDRCVLLVILQPLLFPARPF